MSDTTHRWTVEETDEGGVRICKGYHHRSEDCEWIYYVPKKESATGEDKEHNEQLMETFLDILVREAGAYTPPDAAHTQHDKFVREARNRVMKHFKQCISK
jgi:hypothetical protein